MKRKSQIERAIDDLKGQIAVLQLAITKLEEQQRRTVPRPRAVQKPAAAEQVVR